MPDFLRGRLDGCPRNRSSEETEDHAAEPQPQLARLFEAVARTGRVTDAAAELGGSTAAVSQQLKQLKEQWGVRLQYRRLTLTLDGVMLFQTTTAAFRMIRGARSAVLRQSDSQQLSMRSSPSFAVRWLTPRLKDFLDLNPDWGVRVDASPDFCGFRDRGDGPGPALWFRQLARAAYRMHHQRLRHPAVQPGRSRHAAPKRRRSGPAAWHRAADPFKALYRWDLWLVVHGIDAPGEQAPLRFDRSSMAIQLALDGAGVVLDSVTLAFDELQRGTLVPLSTAFPAVEFPAYWIVCPTRHMNRRIVRLFIDWLRDQGARYQAASRQALDSMGCTIRMAYAGEPGLL